jgi:hypothetical protein
MYLINFLIKEGEGIMNGSFQSHPQGQNLSLDKYWGISEFSYGIN